MKTIDPEKPKSVQPDFKIIAELLYIAALLYEEIPEEQLQNISDIEVAVRQQVLAYISPLLEHVSPLPRTKQKIVYDDANHLKRRIPFVEQILPKNAIGAEVGVMKGHFSPVLLENTNAVKLHLIDSWYFLESHWSWASGNQSTVDALTKVLQLFKKQIEDGRILVHIGEDLQILPTFPDRYFDWVYIDTSHTYEQTKQELQILSRKVKDNGVIAGDDWRPNPDHIHHGVYKAVNEFVSLENYNIVYSNERDLQWAIKKN